MYMCKYINTNAARSAQNPAFATPTKTPTINILPRRLLPPVGYGSLLLGRLSQATKPVLVVYRLQYTHLQYCAFRVPQTPSAPQCPEPFLIAVDRTTIEVERARHSMP